MKWAMGITGLFIGFLLGAASIPLYRASIRNDILRSTVNSNRFDYLNGFVDEVRDRKTCLSYFIYEAIESGTPIILFSEKTKKCKEEK